MSIDKVIYWKDLSDYDMATAVAMFDARRWLYVGFMCHQVIEKVLKAYWAAKKPDDIPYTHNLMKFVQSTGLTNTLSEEQTDFISMLMPLNIEARYPDYKHNLAMALSETNCSDILGKTKELHLWIKNKL